VLEEALSLYLHKAKRRPGTMPEKVKVIISPGGALSFSGNLEIS
jgi:hypothetical protein